MKGIKEIIFTVLVLVSVSGSAFAEKGTESAYDRVMRTGVLRCGYIVWNPIFMIDPNTKAMSGLSYDVVNAIGKELGLKVDWVEETGWGTFAEGLNTGRYDMLCTTIWASGDRAKAVLLTHPIAHQKMLAYARADDSHFGKSLDALNSPEVAIAVVDSDPTQKIRQQRFPMAKEVTLSADTDSATYLLTAATRKADIVFADEAVVAKYNSMAEVKLKPAVRGMAVNMFGNVYALKSDEIRLKNLIDTTIDILNDSGVIGGKIKPYYPAFIPIENSINSKVLD